MSQDREPHQDLNIAHNRAVGQESFDELNTTPEPLYRLRVAVLKDQEGSRDCPLRMFIFVSHRALKDAVDTLSETFGGAFSEYEIVKEGVLEGENGGGVEDGRTEDLMIKFDSQTADESWHEFLGRMDGAKKSWLVEELGVKTQRGKGVEL